uniref:Uncharacterized protein n=1 Tax=Graphocephala atropunctata TaxID=36148 RepID=A0A1B6M8F1_9HEMI
MIGSGPAAGKIVKMTEIGEETRQENTTTTTVTSSAAETAARSDGLRKSTRLSTEASASTRATAVSATAGTALRATPTPATTGSSHIRVGGGIAGTTAGTVTRSRKNSGDDRHWPRSRKNSGDDRQWSRSRQNSEDDRNWRRDETREHHDNYRNKFSSRNSSSERWTTEEYQTVNGSERKYSGNGGERYRRNSVKSYTNPGNDRFFTHPGRRRDSRDHSGDRDEK